MPINTPQAQTIITPTKSALGSVVKDVANKLRYVKSSDDPVKTFSSTGEALGTIQKEIDQIVNQLRQPLPQTNQYQVLDNNGNLIAEIGDFIDRSDNVSYNGIWTSSLRVGGTGPSNSTVKINITPNIAIDVNGVINATGYQAGGAAGLSTTKTADTIGFTTAANGVFGTPAAGQSNGTVVIGITVTPVNMTFTDGLLTA